jgi:UDP-2-acetamido-3-amino-2,3-dideoxy-glucuronate N-acetyltransferase
MKNNNQLNIAVVGGGYWGKNLVRNFKELGVLHTLCDTDQAIRDESLDKCPGLHTTDSYDQVLADPVINAVVIATPAAMHYQMTKEALHAGKDVLVEKPLALTLDEGHELAALAASLNKVLMVGHILEYHPAVQKLSELIKEGELGQIQYVYSNRLNMGKLRTEENVLWSFAPHDIAVIIRLLGEMPATVSATGGEYLNSGIADVTLTNLAFKSGVKAHIFVSWLHPFKEQKLVVVGSKKMAVFDDTASDRLVVYPHRINWVGRRPVAEKAEAETVEIANLEPLKEECRHFITCIEERKEPLTGADEALRVLAVLAAAQDSLEHNGQQVKLKHLPHPTQHLAYYVHPTAIVEEGAQLGKATKVWHFSHVMPETVIGENCNIGQNVFIARNTRIGNNVKIQNNVSIYEGVILEDDVFCGPSCVFTNVKTPRSAYPRNTADDYTETLVKKGVSIGANATIVCGVIIGEYALIGAGAVVTRDVPAHAVVYGNPSKLKGWVCKCGTVIVDKKADMLECDRCDTKLGLSG